MPNKMNDLAHEVWAAAQLVPGEGIEDGVARIVVLLSPVQARVAELEAELPDSYSQSKDWKQGNSVSRIQWLKIMLESYRAEVKRLEDQTDYRSLLKKFVAYLNDVEGCDFIDPIDRRYEADSQFTDEEWAILRTISAEQ